MGIWDKRNWGTTSVCERGAVPTRIFALFVLRVLEDLLVEKSISRAFLSALQSSFYLESPSRVPTWTLVAWRGLILPGRSTFLASRSRSDIFRNANSPICRAAQPAAQKSFCSIEDRANYIEVSATYLPPAAAQSPPDASSHLHFWIPTSPGVTSTGPWPAGA
jgi:hypothetical protein